MSGHSKKRPWLAALLALIYPGAGHVYLREWLRALLWFGVMYTTAVLAIPESAIPKTGMGFSFDAIMETTMQIINALPRWAVFALFILSVLNIIDAYQLARKRNQRSETTTDTEAQPHCPHCGRETDPAFDFCQWCTEPLDADHTTE